MGISKIVRCPKCSFVCNDHHDDRYNVLVSCLRSHMDLEHPFNIDWKNPSINRINLKASKSWKN